MRKNLITMDVVLAKELKYLLETEEYPVGKRLPSERSLAEHFQVNRLTLRNAIQILLDEKYLVSQQKCGYYIAPKRHYISLNDTHVHNIKDLSITNFTFQSLCFERMFPTPDFAERCGFSVDEELFYIRTLCFENNVPIAVLNNYIPVSRIPRLKESELEGKTLKKVLSRRATIIMDHATYKLSQTSTTPEQAELFQIEAGAPLISFRGKILNHKDVSIYYFEDQGLIDSFALMHDA